MIKSSILNKKLFLSLCGCLAVVACSSSSDNDDATSPNGGDSTNGGNGSGSGDLTFLVRDDQQQPLADVVVALYNNDNQTIASTVVTKADGKATFSADDRSTVTIAYSNTDEQYVDIYTFYDLQNRSYVLDLGDDDCTDVASINIDYSNHTANAAVSILQPFDESLGFAAIQNTVASHQNVTVCEDDVQTDGTISHISLGVNEENLLVSYGFQTDQALNNGGTYQGSAGISPTLIDWSVPAGSSAPEGVSVGAIRKGVVYSSLGAADNTAQALSGQIAVASQFPADQYYAFIGGDSSEQSCTQNVPLSDLSSAFTGQLIDASFTDLRYNASDNSFSWMLTGNNTPNFVELDLDLSNNTNDVSWSIMLPADRDSVALPNLPREISDLMTSSDLDLTESELYFYGISDLEGYDAAINLRLSESGQSMSSLFSREFFFCSVADFSGDTPDDTGDTPDNGGGDSENGDISLSGNGTSQLSNDKFTLDSADKNEQFGTITFTDVNGHILQIFINSQDESTAVVVSLTDGGGENEAWISNTQAGMVDGVTITNNSVSFTSVTLESASGSLIIINGELPY